MKKIAGLVFVTLLAGAASACVVRGSAHVAPVAVVEVEEAPPPPRQERVVIRPGFVWVDGRWDYRRGRYVWVDGRYERERRGHRWVNGHWERRGRRHVWIDGHWSR
jgi:hypothetical protein